MITEMLGKKFTARSDTIRPCWLFCQQVLRSEGRELPDDPQELKKVDRAELLDVALFNVGGDWHAGVVWPDGLHFVHAHPERDDKPDSYVVSQDRLTIVPWKPLLRGFYR